FPQQLIDRIVCGCARWTQHPRGNCLERTMQTIRSGRRTTARLHSSQTESSKGSTSTVEQCNYLGLHPLAKAVHGDHTARFYLRKIIPDRSSKSRPPEVKPNPSRGQTKPERATGIRNSCLMAATSCIRRDVACLLRRSMAVRSTASSMLF